MTDTRYKFLCKLPFHKNYLHSIKSMLYLHQLTIELIMKLRKCIVNCTVIICQQDFCNRTEKKVRAAAETVSRYTDSLLIASH